VATAATATAAAAKASADVVPSLQATTVQQQLTAVTAELTAAQEVVERQQKELATLNRYCQTVPPPQVENMTAPEAAAAAAATTASASQS